jgi:AcrR family transcriptional regulator
MAATRKYELRKRAEQLDETRRRITEATVELHRTVGPAATTISEVARRAGVQRVTVYNHFADDASLFAACSAHWTGLHPTPDPAPWAALPDPGERLRVALRALYAWFRETEPMTANVLRDSERLPELRALLEAGLLPYLDRLRGLLAEPFAVRGRRRRRLDAALAAATDLHFWRTLAPLGDEEAAELGAGLVELAAAQTE